MTSERTWKDLNTYIILPIYSYSYFLVLMMHFIKNYSKASKSKVPGVLRTTIPYIKQARISAFSKK